MMTLEEARSASPLPWLATKEEDNDLPRQPWHPVNEERTYFALSFHPSLNDHKRCLWRILYIGPNFALHYTYAVGVIFFMWLIGSYGVDSLSAKRWIAPTSSLFIRAIAMTISFCAMGPLSRSMNINELLKKVTKAGNPRNTLTVTDARFICDTGIEKVEIAYADIFSVLYHKGDLYVRAKAIKSFYVPCSAFEDPQSMPLLYEVVYSLWKNNGESGTLSAEARKRFMNSDPAEGKSND